MIAFVRRKMDGDEERWTLFYIGNIPPEFHSADLRAFFSQFIESKGFKCFHYRHRPELQSKKSEIKSSGENSSDNGSSSTSSSTCCIVKVFKESIDRFKTYSRTQWCDKKGIYHSKRVLISDLSSNIASEKEAGGTSSGELYLSKKEKKENAFRHSNTDLSCEDVKKLPELNPPPLMPQGNVGTPLMVFMQLIKECRFPASMIKKLDLQFPKSYSKRKYGSVPFEYGLNGVFRGSSKSSKEDASQHGYDASDGAGNDVDPLVEKNCQDEHGDAEDWERHEALHDDVDTQARTKERLFEEDLEVKWEKGGSGLVFYTDAYFWHEMKGKDFDEDTTDDWDVDMGVYYGEGPGDMDSRHLYEMRKMKQMRQRGCADMAEFEKFTSSFGSKELVKHGWKKGKGVGSWTEGISDPVEANGQHPRNKSGLGYYGEKLSTVVKKTKRRAQNDVFIATKYDNRDDCDADNSDVYRRNGPHDIKYKKSSIDFVRSKTK